MLANSVHTTGVNWDSIAVIMSGFAAIATALSGVLVFAIRRSEAGRKTMQEFVIEKVTEVTDKITDKLGDINKHLANQDTKIDDTRDKVMQMRGKRKFW